MAIRRLSQVINYCWSMAGITLVFLLVLEIGARKYNEFRRGSQQSNAVLSGQDWGRQYISDAAGYRWRGMFVPYVNFRQLPYQSRTINIDKLGIRTTPGGRKPSAGQILAFGGSTMLGFGVPDWGTIPAYLATRLAECGADFGITNYAVNWWTSSQSVAQLIVLLRRGSRPKVVIFYDGINDIDVVTIGGTVGGIAPSAELRLSQGLNPDPSLLRRLVARSELARAIVGEQGSKSSANPFSLSPGSSGETARDIVRTYEENVRLVQLLAKEYGFRAYFFWQPFPLIGKKALTEGETTILADRSRRTWEVEFVRTVYAAMASSTALRATPNFHSLEQTLENDTETMYIDSEHLLPRGNEKIAEAMLGFMALCPAAGAS